MARSPGHFKLLAREGRLWLQDLGQRSRPQINGKRIREGELVEVGEGSTIKVGFTEFTVERVHREDKTITGSSVLDWRRYKAALLTCCNLLLEKSEFERFPAWLEAPEDNVAAGSERRSGETPTRSCSESAGR